MIETNIHLTSEKRDYGKIPIKVSVIMPTFRRDSRTIERAIDCLLLQDMPFWELLICSDGEYERHVNEIVSRKLLNSFHVAEYHSTLERVPGSFGNYSRQAMLERARGLYVMFLDDDNIILPRYMRKMIEGLKVPEDMPGEGGDYNYSTCGIMHFGPLNASKTGPAPQILSGRKVELYHIDTLQVMCLTSIMKRTGWDTEAGYLADGVTFEKIAKKYKGCHVDEVLAIHM